MNENEMRSLFREMREEAVPADSLARVRLAVEQRRQQRSGWLWLVPALLVTAAIVMVVLYLRPVPQVEPPVVATVHMPPPVLPVVSPRVRVPVRIRRPMVRHPEPGTVVRIETDDPNVVILLVGE